MSTKNSNNKDSKNNSDVNMIAKDVNMSTARNLVSASTSALPDDAELLRILRTYVEEGTASAKSRDGSEMSVPTVSNLVSVVHKMNATSSQIAAAIYMLCKLLVARRSDVAPAHLQRLRETVQAFVSAKCVEASLLHAYLDIETRELLLPKQVTDTARVQEKRIRTRTLYTQTRFNLLWEESEGFSKALALFASCATALEQNSLADNEQFASAVVNQLLALTGFFRLDTNRIAALVLRFTAQLVFEKCAKEYRGEECQSVNERERKVPFELVLDDVCIPPLAKRMIDQFIPVRIDALLGALLAAPATSTSAREHLLFLVYALLRHGKLTVAQILPYLREGDNANSTQCLHKSFDTFERELLALSRNGSALTPPLEQNKTSSQGNCKASWKVTASDRDVAVIVPRADDGPCADFARVPQELDVLVIALRRGRWSDARLLINAMGDNENGTLDIAAHPPVAFALSNLALAAIRPALSAAFSEWYPAQSAEENALAALGEGFVQPVKSTGELLQQEGPGAVVEEMLSVLGSHARRSPKLLFGICRLLRGAPAHREGRAFRIMRDAVLPSLCVTQSNAGLCMIIWEVLAKWPHTARWALYAHVKNIVPQQCVLYSLAAARASCETRRILKRLTVDNFRQYENTMAKLTHGQALSVFSVVIKRTQGYPADAVTITPVVESLRLCSSLAIDKFLYLLIDQFADTDRDRLKNDGTNLADWFASNSLLLGLTLRKLRAAMPLVDGVLQFLYTKVALEEDLALVGILNDMISCVADIDLERNLTSRQQEAKAGGKILESLLYGAMERVGSDGVTPGNILDFRKEREKLYATSCLASTLVKTGIHADIAFGLAHHAGTAAFNDEYKRLPLKMQSVIQDRTRNTLRQFSGLIDFMHHMEIPASKSRDRENKDAKLQKFDLWAALHNVGVRNMVEHLHIRPSDALMLMRPTLDYTKHPAIAPPIISPVTTPLVAAEKTAVSAVATDTSTPKEGESNAPVSERPVVKAETQMTDVKIVDDSNDTMVTDLPPSTRDASPKEEKPLANAKVESTSRAEAKLSPVAETFTRLIPKEARNALTPELYRAFWCLDLGDLGVPETLYSAELVRVQKAISAWEAETRGNSNSRRGNNNSSDLHRKIEIELRRLRNAATALESERSARVQRQKKILEALQSRKSALFFPGAEMNEGLRENAVSFFLQSCVLPRAMASTADAKYCANFVQRLLALDVPAFDFAQYFSSLLSLVPVCLLSCTESEASSFGCLIKEVLTTLEKWRINKGLFDKEASKVPVYGFRCKSLARKGEPWRHEEYCEYLFDIHGELTDGLCKILQSKEYLHARNTLSVLHIVSDVYPKLSGNAAEIEKVVTKLKQSPKDDLRLAAVGMFAKLQKGQAKRVPDHFFKLKPKPKPASVSKTGVPPAKTSTTSASAPQDSSAQASSRAPPVRSVQANARGTAGTPPKMPSTPSEKANVVESNESLKAGTSASSTLPRSRAAAEKVQPPSKGPGSTKSPSVSDNKHPSPLDPNAPEFKPTKQSNAGQTSSAAPGQENRGMKRERSDSVPEQRSPRQRIADGPVKVVAPLRGNANGAKAKDNRAQNDRRSSLRDKRMSPQDRRSPSGNKDIRQRSPAKRSRTPDPSDKGMKRPRVEERLGVASGNNEAGSRGGQVRQGSSISPHSPPNPRSDRSPRRGSFGKGLSGANNNPNARPPSYHGPQPRWEEEPRTREDTHMSRDQWARRQRDERERDGDRDRRSLDERQHQGYGRRQREGERERDREPDYFAGGHNANSGAGVANNDRGGSGAGGSGGNGYGGGRQRDRRSEDEKFYSDSFDPGSRENQGEDRRRRDAREDLRRGDGRRDDHGRRASRDGQGQMHQRNVRRRRSNQGRR